MTSKANIGIDSPGVNVAVVRNDADGWKFLVLKRAERESYGGYWGFLSGGKQGDEKVAQVVVRELKEETGLSPTAIWATEYVVQFYEPEFDRIWILPLIVAVVPADSAVRLSPENSEYEWLPPRRAKLRVSWKNLARAVEDVSAELEIYPARNWVEIRP
ncbi:MAG TPA: NUDIX domain-containing protein [Acidobacteriota bacterium]|nr:NUDIX domain-containing protein [Acidobacteriota bacterium]